jgi:hypothetical protein
MSEIYVFFLTNFCSSHITGLFPSIHVTKVVFCLSGCKKVHIASPNLPFPSMPAPFFKASEITPSGANTKWERSRWVGAAELGAQIPCKKPPAGLYAYHRFHFKSSRWRSVEMLDIGGCMGTVPRQECVSNSSMRHRELLKWHY